MKISKIIVLITIIAIILGITVGLILSNKTNNNKVNNNNEVYSNFLENSTNEIAKNDIENDTNINEENKVQEEIIDKDKNNAENVQENEVKEVANKTDNNSETENKKIEKQENKENKTETKETTKKKTGKVIVIDPGHQKRGDSSKEPVGPGAKETKAKVTTGATGVVTKQTEAILNLKVGLLLKTELEKRGYTVIMTRTTNEVNISNSQRAEIANKANADAFIRIHADSYESSKVVGMSTLCQTAKNKYNGNLADKSYRLSKCVLDNMVKTTDAKNRGVTRTDTMSGINWAKVPTTIVEMGFLSNPEEDKLLKSDDYQLKLVKGMANGIDEFLK